MELTRRTDYACRIIRAAYANKDAYVSVSDVADAESIPYAFARSIQHDLVHAALLKTVRGAKAPHTTRVRSRDNHGARCAHCTSGAHEYVAVLGRPRSIAKRCGGLRVSRHLKHADRLMQDYFESITPESCFRERLDDY